MLDLVLLGRWSLNANMAQPHEKLSMNLSSADAAAAAAGDAPSTAGWYEMLLTYLLMVAR